MLNTFGLKEGNNAVVLMQTLTEVYELKALLQCIIALFIADETSVRHE